MSNSNYPRLATIRRIPAEEKKPGTQAPYLMTDEEIVEMGGNLEILARIRAAVNSVCPDRHKWLIKKYGKFNAPDR